SYSKQINKYYFLQFKLEIMIKNILFYIILTFCTSFTNVFSQKTLNDTIITLDEVEIHKKVRKPKVRKIIYGKNLNHLHFNRTDIWNANKRYFLIDNLPSGEIMQFDF